MSNHRSTRWAVHPGQPYPLGATFDGLGTNFAVFSAHAELIELCLFSARTGREQARLALPACTDHVWHGYVEGLIPGQLYGLRAHGPYQPEDGHRFNPSKLLIDPYARMLRGKVRWSDVLYGYRVGSGRADLSMDRRDSAFAVPKAVAVDPSPPIWSDADPPNTPWSQTIIYETHVRGMTMRHPGVPARERGTFAALASEPVLDHLVRLGVTAVELLPVHSFLDEPHLVRQDMRNYWGYNSLCFFAPEPRYLSDHRRHELQYMVKRLHAAGIEVILDVVYNHTCEGNELGPTLCYRGLDNASYYRLLPTNRRYYINDTGTGNTLNLSHPRVLQMVMDSLRYWVTEMKVDGFRFDLAATLAREDHGFDRGSGFLDAIRQDPVLQTVKLIAEPWDIGPGGYQLGQFPPPFAEWNDRFRDTVRRFWRGDEGMLPGLSSALLGSAGLFEPSGRRSFASVNFVAAHDGFTTADLVAFARKHNEANGENNQDGHSANYSANYGVEGPTDDPDILALRTRQQRNLIGTVLLAQGTPMLLGGDEFGRSQQGNNNAYCQDNETTWFDWTSTDDALMRFTQNVIALRQRNGLLRQPRYLHGRKRDHVDAKDVTWLTAEGKEKTDAQWQEVWVRCIGMALADDHGRQVMVIMNAHHDVVEFHLPNKPIARWKLVLDTMREDGLPSGQAVIEAGGMLAMPGRSLRVLESA
ncbi:MAG: glycogen debranching protein GlgX [Geminicoccaceae bacterium]